MFSDVLLMFTVAALLAPKEYHRITRETFRTAYPSEHDKARIAAAQDKRNRKNAKRVK